MPRVVQGAQAIAATASLLAGASFAQERTEIPSLPSSSPPPPTSLQPGSSAPISLLFGMNTLQMEANALTRAPQGRIATNIGLRLEQTRFRGLAIEYAGLNRFETSGKEGGYDWVGRQVLALSHDRVPGMKFIVDWRNNNSTIVTSPAYGIRMTKLPLHILKAQYGFVDVVLNPEKFSVVSLVGYKLKHLRDGGVQFFCLYNRPHRGAHSLWIEAYGFSPRVFQRQNVSGRFYVVAQDKSIPLGRDTWKLSIGLELMIKR